MRKITAFLAALSAMLLCACGASGSDITPYTKGITFTADITLYNECCSAEVSVSKDGETRFELISPENVEGLTLIFSGSEVHAEFDELEYPYSISPLDESGMCGRLYAILADTFDPETKASADADRIYVSGEAQDAEYNLYLGATGLPISAESINGSFSAVFKNVTITP